MLTSDSSTHKTNTGNLIFGSEQLKNVILAKTQFRKFDLIEKKKKILSLIHTWISESKHN